MKRTISFLIIVSTLILGACEKGKTKDLELKILNDSLVSTGINNNSFNVVRYCLENNSEHIYYINNKASLDSLIGKFVIYKNGIYFSVFNENGKEVKYNVGHQIETESRCVVDYEYKKAKHMESILGYENNLKYFRRFDNDNFFFIYPHQKIYFELPLSLNKVLPFDGTRIGTVQLDFGKDYFGRISLASDSTNYKSVLPREILRTIKENNAKVYHGKIISNKVPIKVVE